MLNDRRRLVLKAIIDEFIESNEPVGSKSLIRKYAMPYSSATVRNEMVILEELGLLEKTHTSSGRIPSEDGYKFYIENLIDEQSNNTTRPLTSILMKDERTELFEKLVQVVYQDHVSFDEKIREIIRLISKITGHTAFYLGPSLEKTYVTQLRLVQISQHEGLILLRTNFGKIETKIITIRTLSDYAILDKIITYMNEMLIGNSLSVLVEKLNNEIAPVLSSHISSYAIYHDTILDFFESFIGSAAYFSGQVNMITDDTLSDFRKLKAIFNFFEDEQAMQWFKSSEVGIDVHIGEEIRNELFSDCAVVRLTFEMPAKGHGTIGIIGPKRMNYNDIIQLLTFVRQFVDKGGTQ
jgi:heat shock gene repressor HrcA